MATDITDGIVPSIKELSNGDLLIGVTRQRSTDGKLSGMTDYFVICSVGSTIQARVVADAVLESLKGTENISHIEGYESARWVLIDCYQVILHVFLPDVRSFYSLERLWGDAPREEFPDGS